MAVPAYVTAAETHAKNCGVPRASGAALSVAVVPKCYGI